MSGIIRHIAITAAVSSILAAIACRRLSISTAQTNDTRRQRTAKSDRYHRKHYAYAFRRRNSWILSALIATPSKPWEFIGAGFADE